MQLSAVGFGCCTGSADRSNLGSPHAKVAIPAAAMSRMNSRREYERVC
jgi:hypothetical protein